MKLFARIIHIERACVKVNLYRQLNHSGVKNFLKPIDFSKSLYIYIILLEAVPSYITYSIPQNLFVPLINGLMSWKFIGKVSKGDGFKDELGIVSSIN